MPIIAPHSAEPDVRPDALDFVVSAIEEDIIFGRLLPRERLVEEDLLARFAVKRHVVRQAIVELEKLGIVRKERNKGASVRDFDPLEVEHIYAMRELLQRRAAELVRMPPSPTLLEALRGLHERHSAAVERNDLRETFRANNDFHDTLFQACGNPYLARAIAEFAAIAHAIRSYRIGDPALLKQARDEHGEMIDALEQGDRARFVSLCVDHIKPSKIAYLQTHRSIPESPASEPQETAAAR